MINKTPLPFRDSLCHLHRCDPCCKDKEKTFQLPVSTGFIPFQFCIDGTFIPPNQIEFFSADTDVTGCDFTGNPTPDFTLTTDLSYTHCDGKTYVSWNGLVETSFFFVWSSTSITYGQTATSVDLPTGRIKVCVDLVGTGYKEIRLIGDDAQLLYQGTDDGNLCFEVTITGTTQMEIEYVDQGGIPPLDSVDIVGDTLCLPGNFLDNCFEGIARISIPEYGNFYSEVFKVYENMDCFIRFDYETPCNDCTDKFTGWFWLKNDLNSISSPQYPIEIFGEDDDNNEFITEKKVISETYILEAGQIPEYLVSFINYLDLCDLEVSSMYRSLDVISMVLSHDWTSGNCLAKLTATLTTDKETAIYCC